VGNRRRQSGEHHPAVLNRNNFPCRNPYLGILTYIIGPSIMIFGLLVVVVGIIPNGAASSRRARTDFRGPTLDLNDPRA
jgi:hypothetical protein